MKPITAIAPFGLALLTLLRPAAYGQPGWPAQPTPFAQALEHYSRLSQRTILCGNHPRAEGITFPESLPAEPAAALAALKAAIEQCGVELVHQGEKFVLVLPKDRRELEANSCWQSLKAPPAGDASAATNFIRFPSVDGSTALQFFADFTGRTILRQTSLPAATLSLVTRTPLTRAELVYAWRVVFALHGTAHIQDGDHFDIVVSLSEVAFVKPGAPVPKPGERVYQPDEVPEFAPKPPLAWANARTGPSRTTFSDELKVQYQRLIRELGIKPKSPLERMVHFYASLSGQRWMPSQIPGVITYFTPQGPLQIPGIMIDFTPQGPLTKAELLYALKTTLALNNLYVVPVDKHSFQLVTYNELRAMNLPDPLSPAISPSPTR